LTLFPEKMRRTVEKLVNEMRVKENVYGVGLFGSWSRGDAASSSDIDILILDKNDFHYEYVERIEANGYLVDLDHIPIKWLHGPIPPEIDQKLYETQILYDRDWSLNNTKLLMAKSYASPERVDIRTETFVVDSDIYLSRATSAFPREDFRSAYLFATVALENILKVLIAVALEPFSNSHFIERLKVSAEKLGMQSLFDEYLTVTDLDKADVTLAKDRLKLFKLVWDEMKAYVKLNPQSLDSAHFKVRTKLSYYLNPAFLQGAVMRTGAIADSGEATEATHYLNSIFLDVVENYVWLKSSTEKVKVDHTTLFRSLETLEVKTPKNYKCILDLLNLKDVDKLKAKDAVERARETILKIRKERKALIKNYLKRS